MSTTKAQLLQEIEPLSHENRVRRLVEWGRKAAQGDAEAKALVDALRQSPDAYERLLALQTVFGSKDGSIVVQGVGDISRTIRRRSCRMIASFCDDAQVTEALGRMVEAHLLRRALAALAKRKRFASIDAFLSAKLQQSRENVIIDAIAFGTDAFLSGRLDALAEEGGTVTWARLCSRHPRLAAAWFLADLQKTKAVDARQRFRIYGSMQLIAKRAPDEALKLLTLLFEYGEQASTFASALSELVRSRPRETFDLLKARHEKGGPAHPPGFFGVVRFDKVAHLLGPERLEYLIRHAYSTLRDGKHGVRWFLRLATGDQKVVLRTFLQLGRGAWGAFLFRYIKAETDAEKQVRDRAFDRFSRAAQGQDGTISIAVLDWLPQDLRIREARRHLDNCASLTAKPERRNVYAGLLPFADAKQTLAPWLGHPEGEERSKAQAILISSVRHDHAALGEAIANIKARKFEQDPVRCSMLGALVALRVALFKPEHLDALSAVLQDALDAADLSRETASHIERLVARLFRLNGAWGAQWLQKLLQVRGSVLTYGLGDNLTNAQAAELSPALADLMKAWLTRERAFAIITLAQSLGIRLSVVEPVLDALEQLAKELPYVSVSAASLGLLAKHGAKRFTRLAPMLVKEDESFVLLPVVARHLSLRRQDLLSDRLLSTEPIRGRYATGKSSWIVHYETGFARWTQRQQRLYASGLLTLLAEETMDVPTLRFAIDTVVLLPFIDASPLLPYAADPRQPVREMMISALPWLDARQGLHVLLEALGDDRSRWAIYALRKAFSELDRATVLAELRNAPMKKVTVAKEVIRLLGELGGANAYQDLLTLDKPDLHRDVRVALLRALWDHLNRPETWPIFERAVRDPDWIVASKLADIPLGRLTTDAEERVVSLLSTILGRPEPAARLALLDRIAHIPLRDLSRTLFRRLLVHAGSEAPEEAAKALAAAMQRMYANEVQEVVDRLRFLLPRTQHLVAFLPVITSRLGAYAPQMHKDVALGLLAALKTNPTLTPKYLQLGTRLWDWKELGNVLLLLSKEDRLYYDAMEAALDAVRSCVHPSLLEPTLRDQADPRLRRIGLAALISAASPKNGWTDERRSLLKIYQSDKSSAVAGPALFVFPP